MKPIGSRAEVMHGAAKRTSGRLLKKNLKYNNRGRIVSRRASDRAKKANRLVKAGYNTKKGVFSLNKKRYKSRRRIQLGGDDSDEDSVKIWKSNQEHIKTLIHSTTLDLNNIIRDTPGIVFTYVNIDEFKNNYMYTKLYANYKYMVSELRKQTEERNKFVYQNLVDLMKIELKKRFPKRFSSEI